MSATGLLIAATVLNQPAYRYTLQPGEYEVLVRSVSDPTVNPFTGVWSLATGQAYSSCFYLAQILYPSTNSLLQLCYLLCR